MFSSVLYLKKKIKDTHVIQTKPQRNAVMMRNIGDVEPWQYSPQTNSALQTVKVPIMLFQCAIPHLSDTEKNRHNNEHSGKFKKLYLRNPS